MFLTLHSKVLLLSITSFPYLRVKQFAFYVLRAICFPYRKGEKRNTIRFLSSSDAKQANQLVALVVWSVRSIERFSSRMRLVPLHVRPWR